MEETFYTIDIGCNFATTKYTNKSLENIITKSYEYGVDKIISISNNLSEIPRNEELCTLFENLYMTAGVHPHNAKSIKNLIDLSILRKYATNPKVVAIGEIGLDYNRMFTLRKTQIEVFREQLLIAKELKKPIYLHCRDAFDDFIQVIKEVEYFYGVVHTFTGNKDQAKQLIDLGFYFGITGWLLDKRRNADLVEAVKIIPIERIMVETDAPWLSIRKGDVSYPYDTGAIVEEIGRIKKMDYIKLGQIIYETTKKFFIL